jgi:ubiquinone/menaquinone biosynthesis C-methylase UbiE
MEKLDREFIFRGYEIPVNLVERTGGAQRFAEVSDWHMAQLRRYIGIKETDKILEIGCGIGRDAIPLADILTSGSYIGTDTIKQSIEWCTKNITKRHPNFTFIHHDIHDALHNPMGTLRAQDINLPINEQSIDLIILQSVFTHMFSDEILHYLTEFSRVLKPEGRVTRVRHFCPFSEQIWVPPS